MVKILITGSSGFVGLNILKNLINSNTVYATTRKNKISKNKNLKYIFFKNHKDLNKKLKKIKVNTVIHCATHYIKNHYFNDIPKIMRANLEFGSVILENLKIMKVKKFINFCSVWQNYGSKKYEPYNLYSASKNAFLNIMKFYEIKNKNVKYFNLYISDTFGNNDKRVKLFNILKHNYSKNRKIKFISKNLSINILNVRDIVSAVDIILLKKVNKGNYNIINKSNFLVNKVISVLKKNKKFKCKIFWGKKQNLKNRIFRFKKLPFWKPKYSEFHNLLDFILGQP